MLYTLGVVFGCLLGALLYFRIGRFIAEKKWELGRHFRRSLATFFFFPVSYVFGVDECWRLYTQSDGEEAFIYAQDGYVGSVSTMSRSSSIWLHAFLWPLLSVWNVLCLCGIAIYFFVRFCIFGLNRVTKA